MSNQSYYVPDQSRLPIFAAFSLFLLVMGASSTINNIGVEGSNSQSSFYMQVLQVYLQPYSFGLERLFKSI